MTVVTVSPKYQVVIPKDVRERLGIQPGRRCRPSPSVVASIGAAYHTTSQGRLWPEGPSDTTPECRLGHGLISAS